MANAPYGQRLLPQVVDEAARTDPNRVIGMIAKSPNISEGFNELTTSQLANAVNYMSWWIEGKIGKSTNFETVAFFGVTDFRYWVFQIAVIKTGYAGLLPSTKNSLANSLSLLENTQCDVVFYASRMASKAEELIAARPGLRVYQIPEMDEMTNTEVKPYLYTKTWEEAKNDRIAILHSSGSTGTPKPIYQTNAFYAIIDGHRLLPGAKENKLAGISTFAKPGSKYYLGFPSFHLAGYALSLASTYYDAVCVFGSPDTPPNARVVCDIMDSIDVQTLCLPPSVIEDLVKEYPDEFVKHAKNLECILYGGGPLSPDVGRFAADYVQVDQIIGSTEACMVNNMRHHDREHWQWFEWHPTHSGVELEPVPDSDLYEMVIRHNPEMAWFQGIFLTFPNLREYRTRDLFQKHPKKNLWLYKGRNDDVIVLSNGEKFNPVLMEGMVGGHPMVKGVLVTGARHPQCAMLLEPKSAVENAEKFIDDVWPTIEKANKISPAHAQISRNMIMVTRSDKPLPRASKGTVMRHLANKAYAEEIEALYHAFQDAPSDFEVPELISAEDLADVGRFVHKLANTILKKESLHDDEDLFVQGLDSLQTMQLVNSLKLALGPKAEGAHIGARMIYENPTVRKLAQAVQRIVSPESASATATADPEGTRVANMKATLEKLAKDLPIKSKGQKISAEEPLTVILTGTTGSLGSYCLSKMLLDPKIKKVYCLNRAADARDKFMSRNPALEKFESKVEFFKSTFGAPKFGLTSEQYAKLMDDADVIIHNAWKVNFNQALESFVSDHLVGLRHFVELSLLSSRHPSLYFVSSISTMDNWTTVYPGQTIPERLPNDNEWNVSAPMGYGESKLVGERLLQVASEAGIRANVLRVGQIGGPVLTGKDGVWNHQEWFPSLVKSSKSLGAVPRDLGGMTGVDWIPVDVLAAIIEDLVHSTSAPSDQGHLNVFNLVNPSRVKFETLVPTIVDDFSATNDRVQVVSFGEWVAKLEALDETDENVLKLYPSLKIMDFYKGLANAAAEGVFETEFTRSKSETMANMKGISDADIRIWLEQWAY